MSRFSGEPPTFTGATAEPSCRNVFLGLALDKLDHNDESEKAYHAAAKIKDADALAWQGLINLYDKQEDKKLDEYEQAAIRLAKIYGDACVHLVAPLTASCA